jgi:hypothetical protein
LNVFAPCEEARLVIVMEAYADGAGEPGRKLYGVAAFLARPNNWIELQAGFRRRLARMDPPLEVLHMTDFLAAKREPYSTWKRTGQDKPLMDSLLRMIAGHVDYGCAAVLLPEGYETLLARHAERAAENRWSLGTNPYAFCADICLGLINLWFESTRRTSRRVACVFEAGDKGQGEWRASVQAIVGKSQQYRDEHRIIAMTTASKRDAPALQTADILAYEYTHCRADLGEYTDRLRALASLDLRSLYASKEFVDRATDGYNKTVMAELVRYYGMQRGQKKRASRN